MELLERAGALAALAEARADAERGRGRVVLVTGEPGIGKTSLVTRFVRDLGPDARVLFGTCDDLSIPRALGPIRDLVGGVSEPLAEALGAGAVPHEIQSLLIAELELPPRPTVLVLEDVHWADDATLDSIVVLGRRIASLPALLVLTYRGGEAAALRPALGAIRAEDAVFLDLAPLSEHAVATLVGADANEVYAATGGNPFYVTELLASRPASDLPPSVTNAVLGRASRLDGDARHLVELVSVVPGRVRTSVLDDVMPGWPAAAEEPERRQLLEVNATHVRFRHELARHAIRSSVPIAARRRLHAQILETLIAVEADPADVVHHAEAAGADEIVAEYALVAARRAAALDSNRQAYAHYRRALDFADRLPPHQRAVMLEEVATAAYVVGKMEDAFTTIERARAIHGELGDDIARARCSRVQSRFHWIHGDGAGALAKAREAVELLEPLGSSSELARAYSVLSQLAVLREELEEAIAWGDRALELATQLGDESTRAHALVNLGTARICVDPRDSGPLLEAHAVADAVGDRHEAARALNNLGFSYLCWARPDEAFRYAGLAASYGDDHEMLVISSYAATVVAWLRLRAGEWAQAERATQRELESAIVFELLAKTVLTELAVRRGDSDAADRLADLVARAEWTGELQRIVPALELSTEWALISGTPLPTARFEELGERVRGRAIVGRYALRLAAWGAVAGVAVELDQALPGPYGAMQRRDWRGAADAFGEVGWTYDRALMLSLLDDAEALGESLEIARDLGAAPLLRRVVARMRDLGLSVPQGPRRSTRANPAGLTARQLEVLSFLTEGLTNAEIAERLVVSPRTAEHHVAAVLTKLGATTRREAARLAKEHDLLGSV